MCLSGNYSGGYGPMGAKLGREVRLGPEKHLAKTKFKNSKWLPWKPGNSLTAQLLVRWCWIFYHGTSLARRLCMQKISKIYHAVSEIGPPSNCLATKPQWDRSCLDDVTHDVTRLQPNHSETEVALMTSHMTSRAWRHPVHDVAHANGGRSNRMGAFSWVCQILNF